MDLSSRGMLLRSPVAVAVGTKLELKFHPPSWSRPALVEGVVVRHAGNPRKLGVRFVDLPASLEADLSAFIRSHLDRFHRVPPNTRPAPPPTAATAGTAATASQPGRAAPPHTRLRVSFHDQEHFLAEYQARISRDVISVETTEVFEPGTRVELHVLIPTLPERVHLRGRVLGPGPDRARGTQAVAVEILDVHGSGMALVHECAQLFRCSRSRPGR